MRINYRFWIVIQKLTGQEKKVTILIFLWIRMPAPIG